MDKTENIYEKFISWLNEQRKDEPEFDEYKKELTEKIRAIEDMVMF